MTTMTTFLSTPYSAYYRSDVPKEDEFLTHSGPGTPLGEYLRRFWQPVAVSRELNDLPVVVKIMGEELVVFRDMSNRVGVLELHCTHRGTSLEYGIISERGIRCCYHGWLMDVDGRILETPGEPPDSTFKDRLFHGAYPTHEFGGVVFAYMGPPDKKPDFPFIRNAGRDGYDPFQDRTGKKAKFLLRGDSSWSGRSKRVGASDTALEPALICNASQGNPSKVVRKEALSPIPD